MTFRKFFELYKRDKKTCIRENTRRTKEAIVMTKIMPYLIYMRSNIIIAMCIQWYNLI